MKDAHPIKGSSIYEIETALARAFESLSGVPFTVAIDKIEIGSPSAVDVLAGRANIAPTRFILSATPIPEEPANDLPF